ncbi:outer membrane transport energization protein ExbB [Hydrobacter penzbergensis]|jgi:biopolymer transport protein ExbB|uniref:Outer membrane transport energization protein ExbB n=2 Tax=Pseudomonadati TaxID=3379134 RepID=A0A8X8LDP5_9BACT|nr:MotA/TolQ/ExbB proton channel family protein [Hydrobacter penzbergensis]MBN8718746.1 MotA/TolQ/ExbB proton channel family protein [Sediminibacterium magnilacihabitans]PQV61771.1 outer membrane transport energization protein ExbB [Sediminibacterium magnilacihabitans]SDW21240.1 outer membrane transport energization protein ExbB [Hydrobacter penzbergensis]
MFYLLQTDTLQKVAAAAVPAAPEKISMWSLLEKGGWIMYPLYLLLVIAIFVFVERLLAIRRASRIEGNFMSIIRDNIMTGNVAAARNLARNTNNPVARMIDKGIQRIGKPIDAIEKSMENVGKLEMYNMERNLNILSLVAGIAPMFGFLGTIVGMVQLFYGIASTGEYTLNTIAGGIYTKMITSATGLIIGLIAYVGHNYLSTQIDKTANKMEASSAEFIDILQEPTR